MQAFSLQSYTHDLKYNKVMETTTNCPNLTSEHKLALEYLMLTISSLKRKKMLSSIRVRNQAPLRAMNNMLINEVQDSGRTFAGIPVYMDTSVPQDIVRMHFNDGTQTDVYVENPFAMFKSLDRMVTYGIDWGKLGDEHGITIYTGVSAA